MVHLGPADEPSSAVDTTVATASVESPQGFVPQDETAFTFGPHFSEHNPFHRSLRDFDLNFRCKICFDLYKIPVSLYPCLHSFCSICIRKTLKVQYQGMKRKAECPVCNANLLERWGDYEKSILQNKELENKVDLYKGKLREELRVSLVRLDVLEKKEKMNNDETPEIPHDETTAKTGQVQPSSSSKRARRSTANYQRDYSHKDDDGDETMTTNDGSRATTSAARETATLPAAASAPSVDHQHSQYHQQQQQQNQTLHTRKPTISYHGLKRKKLIELCQKEGLATYGSDHELKQRHADFIMLYNAQCDSQHPMSGKEVVDEIMKQEKCLKREAAEAFKNGSCQHSVYMKQLAENMSGGVEEGGRNVTTGSKTVDKDMNAAYKSMIERLKARKQGEKLSGGNVPRCILDATAATNDITDDSKPRAAETESGAGGGSGGGGGAAAAIATSSTSSAMSAAFANEDTQHISFPNDTKPKTTPSKKSTLSSSKNTRATASSSAKNPSVVAALGMWKCTACTFENHKYIVTNALCEMCNTPRPEKENTSNEVIDLIDC